MNEVLGAISIMMAIAVNGTVITSGLDGSLPYGYQNLAHCVAGAGYQPERHPHFCGKLLFEAGNPGNPETIEP